MHCYKRVSTPISVKINECVLIIELLYSGSSSEKHILIQQKTVPSLATQRGSCY